MSGFRDTGIGFSRAAIYAGPSSRSIHSTFCIVTSTVQGNKLNTELLPWHCNANTPKTTLRSVVDFLALVLGGVSIAGESVRFSQQVLRAAEHLGVVFGLRSATRATIELLTDATLSAVGRSANVGGVTPFFSAQENLSAAEKQQQFVQHCSADLHPQGRF